ncbi:hypothetical protein DFQ28_010838 [Apophysomyces sp. BC1034]|nr:hypothetical protein DFQ30_010740 [Apophysomyces sp. BC1015]KAG0170302.1 hypothetical protein DFQ29_009359 [Apophysomyces sp. BC1021]KAG0184601.1 hypothetical protein DFQ28_010838 [Apophysomyces sp. BC1034]
MRDNGRPAAHIVDKKEYSATWKEIIIRVGHVELLVIGGFIGELGSKKRCPFLGPALGTEVSRMFGQSEEFEILVPFEPVTHVRSVRHLRSYTRVHANRLWSFESARYAQSDFRLCHPLAYDFHPTRRSAREPSAASLTSIALSIIADRKYNRSRRQEVLTALSKTNDGQAAIKKNSSTHIQNVADYTQIIRSVYPLSRLLRPLEILVKIDALFSEENEVIDITAHILLFAGDALRLYKETLAPAMKRANSKAVSKFVVF